MVGFWLSLTTTSKLHVSVWLLESVTVQVTVVVPLLNTFPAKVVPVPLWHGILPVLGFRVGPFAYLTDCNRIPDDSWPLLEGVSVAIIGSNSDITGSILKW